ncbi:MAG: hypothetical protein K2H15_00635, partial [Muribaculaceae bacterium]|nr:hypothetical protein [Muribaculaceae bacterium]
GGTVIANQDIHSMEAPDMLIVAPEVFLPSAKRIADLHSRTDGIRCAILTPEQIYNEFSSGSPDITAYRKLLKMWYDRSVSQGQPHTRYCILMGRPSYDNKGCTQTVKREGYPRLPIWATTDSYSESTSYSTDDYIGMLDDNATSLNMNTAKIHVAVGRMPVKTLAEAENACTKLENYITSPSYGSWRNNIMIIADDQDNGVHLKQAEDVWTTIKSTEIGGRYAYEKLYLDAYTLAFTGVGAVYPEAKARMLEKWNEGVAFINFIGHGNPKSLTHENLLTWSDVNSFRNTNLPFVYAATCNFMRWDDDDVSAAETLWLNPTAGVIGMICPSRTVYITLNGTLNLATARYMFTTDGTGRQLSMGDMMVNGKNSLASDNNRLRYG